MTPDQMPAVAEVAVKGWSWTTAFVALLNLLVGGALVSWIKQRPAMATIEKAAEDKLIDTLSTRVDTLERQLEKKQFEHDRAIAEVMRLLERERVNHEAELALHRHATRNAKQILIGILDLIEAAPEKASEHATKMRTRMIELDRAEAEEGAQIRGARIIAAGATGDLVRPA